MEKNKQLFQLSASRIGDMRSCSWIFYAKSILKVPEGPTNPKTLIGSLAHIIFEVLKNPRHKHHYNKIIEFPESIYKSKSIGRLADSFIKKNNIPNEIAKDIDDLVITGLKHDFFFKDAEEVLKPEYEFILDNGKYRIKGLIDAAAIYKNKKGQKYVLIRDYKTQRDKFTEDKLKDNIQARVYQLAIQKLFNLPSKVEFILLRHPPTKNDPQNHIQEVGFAAKDDLAGLEIYLENLSDYVEFFDEDKALENLAYDKGFPADNSFSGKIQCGRFGLDFIKKNGEKPWHCSFKESRDYFVLLDKTGKILASSENKDELIKKKKRGQKIEKRTYAGCPRWQ